LIDGRESKMRSIARLIATLIPFALLCMPARAALSAADLATIEAAPAPDAVLPSSLSLEGENGEAKPLRQWLGDTPSVWILADYTCQTLCGPVISIVSEALERSGLRPGLDFRLIVAGLDPKDSAADAATMKGAQIGTKGNLAEHAFFLRGTAENISGLTRAFGFRSVYDREHDQFAHPAAAFVVTQAGRIARVLSGLALDPADLRLALVDAGEGRVGTWTDHVRLLCYGFDPAKGIYTAAVGRMLSGAAAITIIALGLFILILFRREAAPRG
jgi:protein SCO1/2